MSFFLHLVDKIKKLISPGELPSPEEHLNKKKYEEKLPSKIPEIKINTPDTKSSGNKNYVVNNLEHRKYTRARKLVKDYVVFDFETTGLSPFDSQIIQIGAIKYKNHQIIDEYTTYINPLTDISSRITRINGITNKTVENAPLIQEALPTFIDFIGDYHLVAHNASFDMKFLLYNMNNNNLKHKKYRVIDTLSLARKHIQTSNHKLVTLKEYFKLYEYQSHSALDDCFVTGEVYKYCYDMEVNPPLLKFKDVNDYKSVIELYNIGERLYKNKQMEDAERFLLASIDKGNDTQAPFHRLAIIYRKQKRYQDEINICKLAKVKVSDPQGNYRDEMFNKRIKRVKELM